MFDFILENLPEDIKLRAKKEVGATSSLPAFFCSIFVLPEILAIFLTKDLFFEFTPGIKNRNNRLWRYIYGYIYLKELQGKKIGGPVPVHPGASSVQLFTSVTNGKLAHPVGGGDVMKDLLISCSRWV